MTMFGNVGRALALLRELRGMSQAKVAREARIGKSQLSKYENSKELPKFNSLEKLLKALKVSYFEFFYTLYLIDRRAADLGPLESEGAAGAEIPAAGPAEGTLYMPPFTAGNTLLGESADAAFRQVFADLLLLYRRFFEQIVFAGTRPRDDVNAGG